MKIFPILILIALGTAACAPPAKVAIETDSLRTWSFEEATVFPADGSLVRPEDGVVLPDRTLIVADQIHGLVVLSSDGSKRPFGNFAETGYLHDPPDHPAGPNGVSLDPDGKYIHVADIFTGAIYRVDVENETTERIYQHTFGVNSAHGDSTGAIWFTQSTENTAGPESEARMFAAADRPLSDGALFRIAPPSTDGVQPVAERKLSGLDFANGLVLDEARSRLYVAETMADQVLGFQVSLASGELSDRRVVAYVLTPDNLELDDSGQIWVASPIHNEVVVIDPDNGETRSVFRPASAENDRLAAEWKRRGEAGESRLELITPDMWAPMPGLLTGIILTPGGGPVYLTGLGNALIRLD